MNKDLIKNDLAISEWVKTQLDVLDSRDVIDVLTDLYFLQGCFKDKLKDIIEKSKFEDYLDNHE